MDGWRVWSGDRSAGNSSSLETRSSWTMSTLVAMMAGIFLKSEAFGNTWTSPTISSIGASSIFDVMKVFTRSHGLWERTGLGFSTLWSDSAMAVIEMCLRWGCSTARKTGLYTVQLCWAAAKCMLNYHETAGPMWLSVTDLNHLRPVASLPAWWASLCWVASVDMWILWLGALDGFLEIARSSLSAEIPSLAEGEQELMTLGSLSIWENHTMQPARFQLHWWSMRRASLMPCRREILRVQLLVWRVFSVGTAGRCGEHTSPKGTTVVGSFDAQLSDGLTKPAPQELLKNFLLRGQLWNFKYDPQFVAAKKKPREDRMTQSVPETPALTSDWALSVAQMLEQAHSPFGNSLWGV